MSRKKVIAANWKMYKTPEQTTAFFQEFLPLVAGNTRDEIVVCPPYIDLQTAVAAVRGSNVAIGAQNAHWDKEGAFTGEISVPMLNAIAVTHVILGHSERRQYFNETDDSVNRKLEFALEGGLTPIVCVGEVLEEREAGLTEDVLRRQCMRAFNGISAKKAAKMCIAYEPVWAIGTGRPPARAAADAHSVIRHEAAKALGDDFAAAAHPLWRQRGRQRHRSDVGRGDRRRAGWRASLDPKNLLKIVQY
jgi:triosephosphate isomerase